jgi:hypothetical protein
LFIHARKIKSGKKTDGLSWSRDYAQREEKRMMMTTAFLRQGKTKRR